MRKELVSVIDLHGYWSNILCVSCSEGKQISSSDDMIENIRECQPELAHFDFIVEGEEIYAMVDEVTQINPGDKCKQYK